MIRPLQGLGSKAGEYFNLTFQMKKGQSMKAEITTKVCFLGIKEFKSTKKEWDKKISQKTEMRQKKTIKQLIDKLIFESFGPSLV